MLNIYIYIYIYINNMYESTLIMKHIESRLNLPAIGNTAPVAMSWLFTAGQWSFLCRDYN